LKTDDRARELAKTLDHLILQLRTMEEARRQGEAAYKAARGVEKTVQSEPDNLA